MSKAPPDFSYIKPEHRAIDGRLVNWARCVRAYPLSRTHPMFSQYRSSEQWAELSASIPADQVDGLVIERAVAQIDNDPREALRWFYVYGGSPNKAAKYIKCSAHGLAELLHQGRDLLQKCTSSRNELALAHHMS